MRVMDIRSDRENILYIVYYSILYYIYIVPIGLKVNRVIRLVEIDYHIINVVFSVNMSNAIIIQCIYVNYRTTALIMS